MKSKNLATSVLKEQHSYLIFVCSTDSSSRSISVGQLVLRPRVLDCSFTRLRQHRALCCASLLYQGGPGHSRPQNSLSTGTLSSSSCSSVPCCCTFLSSLCFPFSLPSVSVHTIPSLPSIALPTIVLQWSTSAVSFWLFRRTLHDTWTLWLSSVLLQKMS